MNRREFTRYEMREVVILFESFTRLGENGMELSPQRAVLDIFDFAPQLDPAVPDFQRRELGKGAHAGAVGFDGRGRGRACPLVRKLRCQRGHRDACSQSLEIHCEVYAGQRLVKIIDVEQNVFFRVAKAPKFIRWQSPQAWTAIPAVG